MLVDCLLKSVSRYPDKVATRDTTRELTYNQLSTYAQAIRRLILKTTNLERVGVMLPASAAGLGAAMGTLWAGKIYVPLNFLLPTAELTHIIKDAQIDLVLSTVHFESQLADIGVRSLYLERLPLKRMYLRAKFGRTPAPPNVDGDDFAAIVYTSGSTAQPKGVCLSYNNFLSNCRAAAEHLQLDANHHLLGMIPPFHVFGLMATTFLPMVLGASITYIPRFSPQAVYRAVCENEFSLMLAIPSMYATLARLKKLDPSQFASIKLAFSGGEPLPKSVYDTVHERTGMSLIEGYGMTETSPIISANQPWAHRVGTVGRPLPGVEIQVRGPDGHELEPTMEGELCVRGPLVMKGYFNRPAETAEVIDQDGWLRTGDIVRVDGDGFISITGRAKDMMIVGGENVYPREIESVLEQHPAVAEAAAIGKPDPSRGEVVVAFVTLEENATADADELRSFCRDRLAGYKIPREVHILDDLPRGPTGKILKRELKTYPTNQVYQ